MLSIVEMSVGLAKENLSVKKKKFECRDERLGKSIRKIKTSMNQNMEYSIVMCWDKVNLCSLYADTKLQ